MEELQSMTAIFPQPREFYFGGQMASFANSRGDNPNAANRDENALITDDHAKWVNSRSIYGPVPFVESEMYAALAPETKAIFSSAPFGHKTIPPAVSMSLFRSSPGIIVDFGVYDQDTTNYVYQRLHPQNTIVDVFCVGRIAQVTASFICGSYSSLCLSAGVTVTCESDGSSGNAFWAEQNMQFDGMMYSATWVWTIPENTVAQDVIRDFVFTAEADGDTFSYQVHVKYHPEFLSDADGSEHEVNADYYMAKIDGCNFGDALVTSTVIGAYADRNVTYYFTDPRFLDDGFFRIDATTGIITLNRNVNTTEASQTYQLTITVMETTGSCYHAFDTATVYVNMWRVQSVEWQEHPNGNAFVDTWTEGLSVYADKDTPDASNPWTFVDVVVTIEGYVPVGGGIVVLDKMDPPNECVLDGYEGDNNDSGFSFVPKGGVVGPIPGNILIFEQNGEKSKTATVSVAPFAGNNYRVKAVKGMLNPNPPFPNFNDAFTYIADQNDTDEAVMTPEVLTVWRRLWMECDEMVGAGSPDTSLLSKLEKACISVIDLEYASAPITSTVIIADSNDPSGLDVSTIISSSRDFTGSTSDSAFWYVQAIAADKMIINGFPADVMKVYKDSAGNFISAMKKGDPIDDPGGSPPPPLQNDDHALGIHGLYSNTVFVFNGAIDKYTGTNHPEHEIVIDNGTPVPYVYPDVSTLKRNVLLHEIIHMFGVADNEKSSSGYIYDIMCYTYNTADCPEQIIADAHIWAIQRCSRPS